MMAVIVAMIVTVAVIVRVIVIVRVRMAEHVFVPVIVAVMMRAVIVIVTVLVNRLDAGGHRDFRGRLRIELLAEEQHQRRSQERKQRDQPDLV